MFCFHNVVPREHVGCGDASLHMPESHFADVVEWIRHAFHVITLDEVVERLRSGRSLGGTAALTFDDAYAGFFDDGLPVLRRVGLPATVFVVPEAAGAPQPFWWDRMGARGLLDEARRRQCLEDLAGELPRVVDAFLASSEPPLPGALQPVPWERLREELGADDLLSIGSHTTTHRNLTALTRDERYGELATARSAIEAELGRAPAMVSYPYGLYNDEVARLAREAGYVAGWTLDRGPVRSGGALLALPRLNVPGSIGLEALECWASGLMPTRRGS